MVKTNQIRKTYIHIFVRAFGSRYPQYNYIDDKLSQKAYTDI